MVCLRLMFQRFVFLRPINNLTCRYIWTTISSQQSIHRYSRPLVPGKITNIPVRTLIKKRNNPIDATAFVENNQQQKIQVFGPGNELLSVLTKKNAKRRADESGMKLVEVDASAQPYPKYQLMTGKDLHALQLKERDSKKAQKVSEKTIRISTKISEHDMEIKVNHMRGHIGKQNRVKLTVQAAKGLEPQEAGKEHSRLLKIIRAQLEDVATVGQATDNGRDLTVLFTPKQVDS